MNSKLVWPELGLMNNQVRKEEPNSFGDWLRQRRRALDWTQAGLAQRIGCTAAMIRKIEAGERKPSLQLAELLATALGVPDNARAAFVQSARRLRTFPDVAQVDISQSAAAPFHRPPHHFPHNLPAPMTSLVDRVRDAANVLQLLTSADVRLVTLLGPPGIGKTRLCIHASEQVAAHFRDGVWFVDLAPLVDAALVLPAIAHSLSVAEVGETPLLDRLCVALANTELLLALDNFEQVSAAATEVAALLRRCKGLKVLATSRTPLLLAGEHEYLVPPLSLPISAVVRDMYATDELMIYEAVQLFVARVRQHQPDFAVTPTNAAQISNICLRLDGIPLALELAAAALRRMTIAQLAAMLHSETSWLHELHSPARDLPPRQRTLTQAVAWSYSLLDAEAQIRFAQLGVFVGGFTADAAQVVCSADQSALAHLTDHSLLARATERWQMLEMVREFALAQMSSGERAAAQQRHAAYFADQTTANLDDIARDYANFRAALVWAIAAQEAHMALTMCIKLCWFWETNGHLSEGLALARAALAMPGVVDPNLRIDALERVSTMAWQGHQFNEAIQSAEDAAILARDNDRPEKLALALNLLGRILLEQGDYEHAEAALQESAQLARQTLHRFNPGCPLTLLGELALACGDLEAAQTHLVQALPFLTRERSSLYVGAHVAMAHTDLAEISLAHGNLLQARHELQQAFPHARLYVRRLRCLLVTFAGLRLSAPHSVQTREDEDTAKLFGAVAGLSDRSDEPLSPFYQTLIIERSEYTQKLLTQREWQAAWKIGYAWTLAQAAAEAELRLGLE